MKICALLLILSFSLYSSEDQTFALGGQLSIVVYTINQSDYGDEILCKAFVQNTKLITIDDESWLRGEGVTFEGKKKDEFSGAIIMIPMRQIRYTYSVDRASTESLSRFDNNFLKKSILLTPPNRPVNISE